MCNAGDCHWLDKEGKAGAGTEPVEGGVAGALE